MKIEKFIDLDVDGINYKDHPDYVDAFISGATAVLTDGTMREATDEELEELNADSELVYEQVLKRIY